LNNSNAEAVVHSLSKYVEKVVGEESSGIRRNHSTATEGARNGIDKNT